MALRCQAAACSHETREIVAPQIAQASGIGRVLYFLRHPRSAGSDGHALDDPAHDGLTLVINDAVSPWRAASSFTVCLSSIALSAAFNASE